jgi:hypothetical protein
MIVDGDLNRPPNTPQKLGSATTFVINEERPFASFCGVYVGRPLDGHLRRSFRAGRALPVVVWSLASAELFEDL